MRIPSSENDGIFWREYWILLGAGLIANATLALISRLPTTPFAMFLFVKDNPPRTEMLVIAAAETVIELTLMIGLGLLAAHSLGLGAPILEKWLRNEPIRPHLRSVLVPALLVGSLVGAWSIVPRLPIFHPNRQAIARDADNLLNSPARTKIEEVLKRMTGRTVGNAELSLSYVCETISGELNASLFLLSGIAWILSRLRRSTSSEISWTILWTAIFLAVTVGAISHLAWQSIYERLLTDAIGGIRLSKNPFWLSATHLLLGSVPGGVALGWLYIRRGLESAMLGSLLASATGYAATSLLVVRLY